MNRAERQILDALHNRDPHPLPWGALLALQDASIPEFSEAMQALVSRGTIGVEAGMVRLRQSFGWPKVHEHRCSRCDARGWVVPRGDVLLERYLELTRDRPPPNLEYDQGAISPEDSVIRASFMRERGDLLEAEVLMVGDFDLTSLAMVATGLPKRVVVLDIDERVTSFVNRAAKEHGLPIEGRSFDVRSGLDPSLRGAFDVFICDPVETLPGIRLYLSRGAEALRGIGSAAYVGLTTIEASRKKWFDIQMEILAMGFALTDIRRSFSGYPDHDEAPKDGDWGYKVIDALGDAGSAHRWYTSSFLRIEAVQAPVPRVTGAVELGRELYVDEEAWATPERRR